VGQKLGGPYPQGSGRTTRLQEGNMVSIEVLDGHVELRRAGRIPTLEELVAQIAPENRHGEIDWGPAVGKEIW
jgi:antitoxin MazE